MDGMTKYAMTVMKSKGAGRPSLLIYTLSFLPRLKTLTRAEKN